MSKPKHINLNEWQIVNTVEELEGFQGLILTPLKVNGFTPPDIYFRKRESSQIAIENPEGVEWHKNIVICTKGSVDEYIHLVNWYYDGLLKDDECRTIINNMFAKHDFNIKLQIDTMKRWLIKQVPSCRKSHLYKYTIGWLNRNFGKHLNYISSKRG